MTYGSPPPYQPYQPRPQAEGATAALILGILGLVACGVLAPFAWSQGNKALRLIAESGGMLDGEGMAKAGKILGIIGTAYLALVAVFAIVGVSAALLSSG